MHLIKEAQMAAESTIPNLAELSSQFRSLAEMASKLSEQIENILAPNENADDHTSRSIAGIIRDVAGEFGVPDAAIRGNSRVRIVAIPRQEVMRRAHDAGFSLHQIGHVLSRDHTTVLHGIKAAKARAVAQ
jgi:chromosomal replication initiation ATPase DnaA